MPPTSADPGVVLTVDVEEWFHAPEHPLGRDSAQWDRLPPSLPSAIGRTLDLLESMQVRATFFTLGWVAQKHPALVRRIAGAGHEIGCHGWGHTPLDRLEPDAFRHDLDRSRTVLQDLLGLEVSAYRAPRWSMGRRRWPYPILAEKGFKISSSRLCIAGLGLGQNHPKRIEGVLEIPALSARFFGMPLPAGGTLALRILPLGWLLRVRHRRAVRGWPAVYWFHPWEVDPQAPRLQAGALLRAVRYGALKRLPARLTALVPTGDCTLSRAADRWAAAQQTPLSREGVEIIGK
ncbi:MAG: polysaccharide deacetylase family protein [Acidobacteriota bacterium]